MPKLNEQNGNEAIQRADELDLVEVGHIANAADDGLHRVNALTEEDIQGFEDEVDIQQVAIEHDFEEIGFTLCLHIH